MRDINVSIVTVCYNCLSELVKTVDSVRAFAIDGFGVEYIVIDGGSQDGTKEYLSGLSFQEGVNFSFVSEPDSGIYDAMNKGYRNCSGKWIIFMNAGDVFAPGISFSSINGHLFLDSDILYGKTFFGDELKARIPKNIENIIHCMPFCHQSVFINRKSFKKIELFDTSYDICGDYDLFLGAYCSGKQFSYVDFAISRIDLNGASSNFTKVKIQSLLVVLRSDLTVMNKLNGILKIFSNIVKYKIKKAIC